MATSPHFRRLAIGQAILIALVTALLGSFVLRSANESLEEALEGQLTSQTLLLSQFAAEDFARFDSNSGTTSEAIELVKSLAAETGNRVTFIRRDGTVAFDSLTEAAQMENHGGRPEVIEALRSGAGSHQRDSSTLGQPFFYVARAAGPDSGVVRVAVPLAAYREATNALRFDTVLSAIMVALLSVGLAILLARRAALPVIRVSRAAEQVRQSRLPEAAAPKGGDEFDLVGQTLTDLSAELKEKLEVIAADEAQFRAMFAGMVEGVLAVDEEGRITFCNRALRLQLGLAGHPVGQSLMEVASDADLESVIDLARQSDSASTGELSIAVRGQEKSLLVRAHRFAAKGRVGVVVVFQDVTELRRLERVRRDFVANVSHELKTPLTSIRGFVETLLDGALGDPQNNRRFLEKIETNVQRLGSLVSDLLSLARIESTDGSIALVQVDWKAVAMACVRRQESHARVKKIELEVDLPEGRTAILGDEEALTQVVDNLLDNALKYTPEGGTVKLSMKRDGLDILMRVQDTGIGIPEKYQERIFERFYRVDKARSRELGGTGLGLSIVKHLVTSMNGSIDVRSNVGQGTTFQVRIAAA